MAAMGKKLPQEPVGFDLIERQLHTPNGLCPVRISIESDPFDILPMTVLRKLSTQSKSNFDPG